MSTEPVRQDAFHSTFFRVPIGIAIAITDLHGRFLECNPAYCAMLGYTPAELQTMDSVSVTHPDDRQRNRELLDQLMRREVPNFVMEKRYLTKAGATIWSRIHVSITADDSELPGNVFKGQLNECNARAFYQRWKDLLQAPTWADVPDRNGTLR